MYSSNHYAPVVIPTLCRFNHFKSCIESLAGCVQADKTDVYIGLDYPAKEEHWDGYRKIKEYLENSSFPFRNLQVFVREHNYGFGPNGNASALINYVSERYETYIFTEDDNIFSPNFLVYMNACFAKFKDDERIFAVNGFTQPYEFCKSDRSYQFFQNDFSAWGAGYWVEKVRAVNKELRSGYFKKSMLMKNLFKMYNHGLTHLHSYITYALDKHPEKARIIDVMYSLYMILEDKYVVCPEMSLVKNIGWDKSGGSKEFIERWMPNFDIIAPKYINQIISQSEDFDFYGNPMEFFEENQKIAVDSSAMKIGWKIFFKKFFNRYSNGIKRKIKGDKNKR